MLSNVYRVGSLAGAYREGGVGRPTINGEHLWTAFDKVRPHGRQARQGAIYSTPTIGGAGWWGLSILAESIRGVDHSHLYWELTVDGSELVHNIQHYETQDVEAYWSDTLTLTEWRRLQSNGEFTEYQEHMSELLLNSDSIISARNISYVEFKNSLCEEAEEELGDLLEYSEKNPEFRSFSRGLLLPLK